MVKRARRPKMEPRNLNRTETVLFTTVCHSGLALIAYTIHEEVSKTVHGCGGGLYQPHGSFETYSVTCFRVM